jgi:hypothetical protein
MTTKTQPHTIIAVLNLKIPVEALIGLVKTIVTNMTSNAYFTTPVPPLATLSADNAKLETDQATALTKTKGAVAARDAQKAIVMTDLHLLKAYVQSVANADEANAEAIIKSAGMSVRQVTPRVKQDLTLKAGAVSGQVKIVAKAATGRASYDWQCSADGVTWTPLPSTLQAHTVLTGQKPGTTVFVRHRAITKTGVGDWGQAVSMLVV